MPLGFSSDSPTAKDNPTSAAASANSIAPVTPLMTQSRRDQRQRDRMEEEDQDDRVDRQVPHSRQEAVEHEGVANTCRQADPQVRGGSSAAIPASAAGSATRRWR